jgi:DNA-binding LytR/AlgR family response regulator
MTDLLIFEDEPAALQRLSRMIKEIRPKYNIIGTADNMEDALNLLAENNFDLILSDIELSDGTCFDIFEKHQPEKPVVYITAYNDYAIKAFSYNGIHYLMKPINYEDLTKAFVKFEDNQIKVSNINPLKNASNLEIDYQKRFISKIGNTYKVVDVEVAMLFYTDSGLVYAKSFDGLKYVLDDTLEKIMDKLNPNLFFRINRQMIVNINAVIDMYAYSSNRLKLKLKSSHKADIIVSKDKTSDFKKWIASH